MEPSMLNFLSDGTLVELSLTECFELLGDSGVGRVAMCTDEGPVVIPVNYLVRQESIIIRTAPYTVVAQHANARLAFEVDELEPDLRRGWSVLLVGQAESVYDIDEMVALRAGGQLQPWASGPRNMFIRITPRRVTGRRVN